MNTEEFINGIRKCIENNDIEGAISVLRDLLQKSKQLDNIILQSARYNDLKQKIRSGTINTEDAEVAQSKIAEALLDMIHDIAKNVESEPKLKKAVDKTLKKSEKQATQNTSKIGNENSRNLVIQGTNLKGGHLTIKI